MSIKEIPSEEYPLSIRIFFRILGTEYFLGKDWALCLVRKEWDGNRYVYKKI